MPIGFAYRMDHMKCGFLHPCPGGTLTTGWKILLQHNNLGGFYRQNTLFPCTARLQICSYVLHMDTQLTCQIIYSPFSEVVTLLRTSHPEMQFFSLLSISNTSFPAKLEDSIGMYDCFKESYNSLHSSYLPQVVQ